VTDVARAVVFDRYGEPDVLSVADVPVPAPGPGEVRLAVRVAGVNPVDAKIRRGELAEGGGPFPRRLGIDVAGVVEAAGEGAGLPVGAEVLGRAVDGGYAEVVICRVGDLVARPPGLAWDVAGSLAVTAETAYRTLQLLGLDHAGAPGRTLLVHGASGGVGVLATQLAVARGARVVGTAGGPHQDLVRGLGAVPVPYGPGWVGRVRAAAPDGIDAVLDCAGAGVLPESVELAGDPAAVVTISDPAAARVGVRYARGMVSRVPLPEVCADLLPLLLAGTIRVPIAARFPLERAADAHRLSERGHPGGRIVLVVRGDGPS
jgi:NADPH:quinone reductase-like Zn-dependent oxidoreductase